jgi:hypothetical protein
MTPLATRILILVLVVGGPICAASLAATRVELIVDEPQAARTVPWPITTGVPFPRGELTDIEHCRLFDDTGREIPLQARVAATWDADRRSIRWLTIDFVAQPGRKYSLEFGKDVRRRATATPLRVDEGDAKRAGPVRVATGSLTAEFSAEGPSALGPIRVDLDGDGQIEPDEIVATGAADGEHYSIDQDGRRASSAGDGAQRQIVVETAGPVRACIRVDGFYTGPGAKRTAAYRTRYHFFAGLGLVKVVDEFRIVGSTRGVRWKDIGFALRLPSARFDRVAVDALGDAGNQILSLRPSPATRSIASFQATYRHYGNPECRGGIVETTANGEKLHKETDRAGEWMQVTCGRAAVTGSLRWFWQQFPKEWEATPDGLRLHLWGPRGGELDFDAAGVKRFFGDAGAKYLLDWKGVRAPQTPIERFFYFAGRSALDGGGADGLGINKHHEFYFHFAPAADAERAQEYGRLAAEPPLALASGQWNCSTDVLGPLAARPNDSPYEAIVDRLFDLGRQVQDGFGDYGWWLFGAGPHYSYQWDPETKRHYADPRRFEHHTYQKETQLWWCYLRSGERKFYDWALPSENHWVDIAVSHAPTAFRTEWRGGQRAHHAAASLSGAKARLGETRPGEGEPATLYWPAGDWSIDSPTHYVRHHDTGEAWLRGQSQFWASYHRTLETTTLAYYLTGDERFNDVIDYWKAYWGDLAGKTSASADFRPWHREQAWYRPAAAGEKPKTWAEMIRDYAPFNSGSRHQLTLFFNLATLYEHTWDAKIGQALREYANAFLDPQHPIGVWRSQDNRGPTQAEAPLLAHYWAPALWKYARATDDPRMPDVLRRYYEACWATDPFAEDVGIYSNVQIGYAYYFTRDPRHLRPAVAELERLRPFGEPLARPEDLGQRLYNPYAPAQSFTAVPRLLWALQEAKRRGVSIPPPAVLRPQRAPIAFAKPPDAAVEATLWGFDRELKVLGPDGKPFGARTRTKAYTSALQPFDRALPGFPVYVHEMVIPGEAPAGSYVLAPKRELAVLGTSAPGGAACNAAVPVAIEPGEAWQWKVPSGQTELRLQSAAAKEFRLLGPDGKERPAKAGPSGSSTILFALGSGDVGKTCRIERQASSAWFRLADVAPEHCWVAPAAAALDREIGRDLVAAALPSQPTFPADDVYVPGRHSKGVLIVPGRSLHLPDHRAVDGKTVRLFDLKQGTVEFWVKRLWDERLTTVPKVTFLTNGLIEAWSPWKLPAFEWAHVAVVWRPLKEAPDEVVLHIYVNGLDQAYYRSTHWEGYGNRPFSLPKAGKWLEEFVSRAPAGAPFALDELRISNVARYADREVAFGPQQTFNPFTFSPPATPMQADKDTLLLFRFDDNLEDVAGQTTGKLK